MEAFAVAFLILAVLWALLAALFLADWVWYHRHYRSLTRSLKRLSQSVEQASTEAVPRLRREVLSDLVRAQKDQFAEFSRALTEHINSISAQLENLHSELERLGKHSFRPDLQPATGKAPAAPPDQHAAAGSPETPGLSAPPAAVPAAASVAPVSPEPPDSKASAHTGTTIEEILRSHFDRIDRETNRGFDQLRRQFEQLLGDKVTRIEEVDNAVLFYATDGTVIVRPWKNARLRQQWVPYFDLDRGANLPVAEVIRPAVLSPGVDGAWIVIQKGVIRNES